MEDKILKRRTIRLLKGKDTVRFIKSQNKMVGACRKNGR
jgi:hypothetical protein